MKRMTIVQPFTFFLAFGPQNRLSVTVAGFSSDWTEKEVVSHVMSPRSSQCLSLSQLPVGDSLIHGPRMRIQFSWPSRIRFRAYNIGLP